MQDHILLAFRKRAKNRGYTNIHIVQARDRFGPIKDYYIVSAVDPLSGSFVQASYSILQFHSLLR